MALNQYQGGNQGEKQGVGKITCNRKQLSVRSYHDIFGGQCEYLSGCPCNCVLTKYVGTCHQLVEYSVRYFSFNFKEVFYVIQAVEIESHIS